MYSREVTLTTPIEDIRFRLTDNAYGYIYRSRIFTIGDLISMSLSDIINEDMLKSYSKLKLVDCIHSLGFKFRDEEVNVIKDGEKILVTLDTDLELLSFLLPKRVNRLFQREGIIKVSDLLSKSEEDLLDISEFGITSLMETKLFVHLLGFALAKKTSKESQITEKTQENCAAKKIDERTHLLYQFEYLLSEKQRLLKKEQKLNEQIQEVLQKLSMIGIKNGQKVK